MKKIVNPSPKFLQQLKEQAIRTINKDIDLTAEQWNIIFNHTKGLKIATPEDVANALDGKIDCDEISERLELMTFNESCYVLNRILINNMKPNSIDQSRLTKYLLTASPLIEIPQDM